MEKRDKYISKVIHLGFSSDEDKINEFINSNSDFYEVDKITCSDKYIVIIMKLTSKAPLLS